MKAVAAIVVLLLAVLQGTRSLVRFSHSRYFGARHSVNTHTNPAADRSRYSNDPSSSSSSSSRNVQPSSTSIHATTAPPSSSTGTGTVTDVSDAECGCGDSFSESFIAQKKFLLLDKLENPVNGNLTACAREYVNFCDESFDQFLNEKIALLPTEAEKQQYGKIRYAVNTARQQKLMEADGMLRSILQVSEGWRG